MALNDIVVPRENAQGQFEELVLPDATTSARGLLSSSDKTKLDSAAWALTIASNLTISADTTLTAGRNVQQTISTFSATNLNVTLPTTNLQAGDTFTVIGNANSTGNIAIFRQNWSGSGVGPQFTGLATVVAGGGAQRFTFRTSSTESASWSLVPVDTHTHAAAQITGLGAAAALNVGTTTGTVAAGDDARLSDSRTPTAHAASHATGGSDPLAPSDISAMYALEVRSSTVISSDTTLTAGRNVQQQIESYSASNLNLTLPFTGNQNGDTFIIVPRAINTGDIVIRRQIHDGSVSGPQYETLATATTSQGEKYTFRFGTFWNIVPVDTHTHAASDITSGTLTHERGGLEADVSAYNGLVKISGGSTSAVTVTSAGEALLDDADAAAQRTTLGLGSAATAATGDFAAASHSHELTSLAATGATNGHVLTANGSNGATFAALPASGVTGAAASASDVLGVSGANITGVDANADRIVFWDDSASALKHLTVGSGLSLTDTTLTATGGGVTTGSVDNAVLRADGTGGSTSQSSDLVIDDATTSTQNNVALRNNHSETDSSLVLCNKGAGSFIVSPARPDGTSTGGNARGARSVCIVPERSNANQVASGADAVAIGARARASDAGSVAIGNSSAATGGEWPIAIGSDAQASGAYGPIAIGRLSRSSGWHSVAIGSIYANASGNYSLAIGRSTKATGLRAISICGNDTFGEPDASGVNSVQIGAFTGGATSLRAEFATLPFRAVYWGGQTTSDTANVELNLDATATNRMTIAANTAVIADIYVIARRTDNSKFLAARRWVAIRRDGSNNTALIGGVQTIETDQSEGSPTWTFTIDADDTASVESLRVRVTGAASETVNWRVCAIYRVVA